MFANDHKNQEEAAWVVKKKGDLITARRDNVFVAFGRITKRMQKEKS